MNKNLPDPKHVLTVDCVCTTYERVRDDVIYTISDQRYPELNGKRILRAERPKGPGNIYGRGIVYSWI